MYNQPMPYSPFTMDAMPHINEPPAMLPQQRFHEHPAAAADTALMAFQRHSRTMTAPPTTTMHPHHPYQHHVDPPMSASSVSPSTSPPAMLLEKSWPDLAHDFLSYQAVAPPPPPPPHPSSPSTLTTSTPSTAAADVHSSSLYPLTTTTPQKCASPPTFMNDTKRQQQQQPGTFKSLFDCWYPCNPTHSRSF